jgi:hypothetical protein
MFLKANSCFIDFILEIYQQCRFFGSGCSCLCPSLCPCPCPCPCPSPFLVLFHIPVRLPVRVLVRFPACAPALVPVHVRIRVAVIVSVPVSVSTISMSLSVYLIVFAHFPVRVHATDTYMDMNMKQIASSLQNLDFDQINGFVDSNYGFSCFIDSIVWSCEATLAD